MFEQIIALPQPQHGWICDGVTNTAVSVMLIAFRERCGEIEYLAQSWRDGYLVTDWVEYVCTKDEVTEKAAEGTARRLAARTFSARDAA